ncbi:hypothetical protein L596_007632 [Steinernema carpocapsae]|uniref:EGF-like domain-containing protein n=1 Tax=Steinernema carpocapsae TaxID=34508 RepID=A0A4U5PA32_STECR|nr:hypothetical protein L596_007632 [Steinernema carpocapsae]
MLLRTLSFILCFIAFTDAWWCMWNCEEETTTTTISTTMTTTTILPPSYCRNCSVFSACKEFTENGICKECVCPEGLTGACCDAPLNDRCAKEPGLCPPFSKCVFQLVGDYRCSCLEKRSGPNCTEVYNPCAKNPCVNNGECSVADNKNGYECSCSLAFQGHHCEIPVLCSDLLCSCRNHKCENNAVCVPNPLRFLSDYSCACNDGFAGEFCEKEIPCVSSNPCQYGGVCVKNSTNSNDFECKCPSIWKGKLCEKYNPCHTLDKMCKNGKCRSVNGSDFDGECECQPGYTGVFCEIDIDDCNPNPCLNGGTCTDKVNAFECSCVTGTTPPICEDTIDDCKSNLSRLANKCQSKDKNAICIDGINSFTCNCSDDWVNENCTMLRIIYDVLKNMGSSGSNTDMVGILNELVATPSLIKDMIPFFLALMPQEKQSEISWDYGDLFSYASFEGAELDVKKDLVKWNTGTLGNCFTFNHEEHKQKYPLHYSGDREGLKLAMKVRQEEYLPWIDTASMLVFVHSSTETVFGESLRFQVKPGTETNLMISQNTFKRLGGAYGVCVEDKDEVESYYYDGEYTVDGCLRSCYQDAVYKTCGCMDPRFPRQDNVSSCTMAHRNCVRQVTLKRGDPSNWPSCVCHLPCANGQFTARWSQSDLKSAFGHVLLSVNFPQIIQQTFKEEPKVDFNKFISNLGGLLGILCGICIPTFIEFGFLIVRVLIVFLFGK